MARKTSYRPPTPTPRPAEPGYGRIAIDGPVHRLYAALSPDERRSVVEAIGLKLCQRVGHRHKIAELRSVTDLDAHWTAVDDVLTSGSSPRASGDLLDPLLAELVERARVLLGDHADEPTVEHMAAMAETLAEERSAAQVRLLFAAVVEFDFTAAAEVRELAASDPRFALVD